MKLLQLIALLLFCGTVFVGCKGTQARVMQRGEASMVGSNRAGAEVYNPLVRSTTAKLLAEASNRSIQQVSHRTGPPTTYKVCFITLENKSMEELGDFKDHIQIAILEAISSSEQFEIVSDRAVTAGLRALSLRHDDLFMPENMRLFTMAMGRDGTPVDYLLFATITSGTTVDNRDKQRDYKLTLELVCTQTFRPMIVSTPMRKEYNNSVMGKIGNFFKR